MGCCQSSSEGVVPLSSITNPQYNSVRTIEPGEIQVWKQVLDTIPSHCRPPIENLPQKRFLSVYKLHLLAINHVIKQELEIASKYERQAIEGLKTLLPNNPDHILFAAMNGILSLCLFKLDRIPEALECCKIAVQLLLRHDPTNYTERSRLYFLLAQCYKGMQAWNDSIACLNKAIEMCQACLRPDEEFIRKIQADIKLITKRINVENFLSRSDPDPGESQIDFQRRKRAVMDVFHAECGFFPYDIAETERIPDEETESQVNETVLEDVSTHLIQYLNEYVIRQFKAGCIKAIFLAAGFKNGRMKTSSFSPAIIEAALTIIIRQIDEYPSLNELPLLLSYTDDSNAFPKGVREFNITAKEGINLNENNKPSYETRDCF